MPSYPEDSHRPTRPRLREFVDINLVPDPGPNPEEVLLEKEVMRQEAIYRYGRPIDPEVFGIGN